METEERKKHWENVFQNKDTTKASWYQRVPETSLRLIKKLDLPKSARIIEVGSGDSYLVDCLLEEGYSNITLLDISNKALETVKKRLSGKTNKTIFLTEDVTRFSTSVLYNLWHDRAVFHFLIDEKDIQNYVKNVYNSLNSGGYLILGTFSSNGPQMCSGLKVCQYDENELTDIFLNGFKKIETYTENHQTPSGSSQNFLFCVFKRT